MMQIAVLADIHGNHAALERCITWSDIPEIYWEKALGESKMCVKTKD